MSSQLTQRDSLDTESELSLQQIVGGRTLIEYAFEPIRQLRESIRQ